MPLVTAELHQRARRYFRRERKDHTLQPTALVNEVYLRMVDQRRVGWQNRAYYFAIAARVLRRRRAAKRGDTLMPLSTEDVVSDSAEVRCGRW